MAFIIPYWKPCRGKKRNHKPTRPVDVSCVFMWSGRFLRRRIYRELNCNFQHVRMSFCPGNVGNWYFPPQNVSGLSSRSSWGCFRPLLQAHPDGRNCRPHFSMQLLSTWYVSNTIQSPDRIEKNAVSNPIPDCNHILLIWIKKVPTAISSCRGPL